VTNRTNRFIHYCLFNESNEKINIMTDNRIKKFLSPQVCEEAGIILKNISETSVYIGAMNPDYNKVRDVIEQIKSEFQLGVDIPKFKGDEKKPKVEYVSDFNLIEVFNSYCALAFL